MPISFRMTKRQPETQPNVETWNSFAIGDTKRNDARSAGAIQWGDVNIEQHAKKRIHIIFLRTCIALLSIFMILRSGEINGGNIIRLRKNSPHNSIEADNRASLPAAIAPRSKNLMLAMLISFPNSGTSFTLSTVRSASRQHVAGTACLENPKQFFPVYRSLTKRGPHFIPVDNPDEKFERPQKFILTKTHCSGYDNSPMPSPTNYIISQEKFTNACHRVCSPEPSEVQPDEEVPWKLFYFNRSRVGSFVHLFRDPFDNIVSRWHCHMSGAEVKHPQEVNKWEKTAAGFQEFCRERDEYHRINEAPYLSHELVKATEGVPCRTDFLRYVQWHNRAFNMTETLNKPVHILHYMDFRDDYNGTMSKLMGFLEQPLVTNGDQFRWSNYSDYYTAEQRMATKRFIKFYASPETLRELARYGIE